MKIVEWDLHHRVPEMLETADGEYLLEDSIWDWNLEIGDLVQCLSEWGTMCYYVLNVEPADDLHPGHGLNIVYLEACN